MSRLVVLGCLVVAASGLQQQAQPRRAGQPRAVLSSSPPAVRRVEVPWSPVPGAVAKLQASAAAVRAKYTQQSEGSHVAIAGLQTGLLSGAADVASQQMHGLPIDLAHVAAMATIAAALSGSLNAVWLGYLEDAFPGTSHGAILQKTLCDYIFCATSFNTAFLALVPVLTALYSGQPLDEALSLWGWSREGFQSCMLLELCTFSPYNLLAFRAVPLRFRPVTSSILSAVCTIVVSGVTLGYWCS